MGGFISAFSSSPSPSVVTVAAPAAVTSDPEEEARKLRLETISRNRRGRLGMIATSERGVLDTTGAAATGKTLLGE